MIVHASAAEVAVGEPLVLSAERLNYGDWQAVERKTLDDGQCWLRRPPPDREPAVADNLTWEVHPPGAHRFDLRFRADHTRRVVFSEPGVFTLESSSNVWCRPGKLARGRPIRIRVRGETADPPGAPAGAELLRRGRALPGRFRG
ncbi:MAG: hypothetical protein PVF91_13670 [Chromatiales bacterium]